VRNNERVFKEEIVKAMERVERLVKFPKVFKDILLGFDGGFQWDFSVIDDPIIRRHVEYYASVFPIKEVIVSESYLLIRRQGTHAFGITEDGKLFFNELPAPDNTFFKIPVYNLPSEIQMSVSKDCFVRELFGFNEFAPDGAILSTEGGRERFGVRLQGEVVADLYGVEAEGMSHNAFILKRVKKGLENYLGILVADLLWGSLLEQGLSPTIGDDMEVPNLLRYEGFKPVPIILEGIRPSVDKEVIRSVIGKYLEVEDISSIGVYNRLVISSDVFGEFDLLMLRSRGGDLELLVVPRNVDKAPIMSEIENEVVDAFEKALQTSPEVSLWIGNHRLILKNFATRTIRLPPPRRYRPIFLWAETLNIDLVGDDKVPQEFNLLSLPNAEIRLEHREHGVKTVYVEPQILLRLRTTNISTEFTRNRNKAVLSLLSPRFK
jgi:hypothetical protein